MVEHISKNPENMLNVLDEPDEGETQPYTSEQRIVTAVWVHERPYNDQTWGDIMQNFKVRFNSTPPSKVTMINWERKLFTKCPFEPQDKAGRPSARLMHVPYVKASLEENPNLSLRERAKLLGIPRTTLLTILQSDLNMTFEVPPDGNNVNRKHAAKNNGSWKKVKLERQDLVAQDIRLDMNGLNTINNDILE